MNDRWVSRRCTIIIKILVYGKKVRNWFFVITQLFSLLLKRINLLTNLTCYLSVSSKIQKSIHWHAQMINTYNKKKRKFYVGFAFSVSLQKNIKYNFFSTSISYDTVIYLLICPKYNTLLNYTHLSLASGHLEPRL